MNVSLGHGEYAIVSFKALLAEPGSFRLGAQVFGHRDGHFAGGGPLQAACNKDRRAGSDRCGDVVAEQTSSTSFVRFFGSTPPNVDAHSFSTRITGSFVPEHDG